MQVKEFEASNLPEAMNMVREQLGDDAIIIDSYNHEERGTTIVRVARDNYQEHNFIPEESENLYPIDYLTVVLEKHNVLPGLMDELIDIAQNDTAIDDPIELLSRTLEQKFIFQPLPRYGNSKPMLLVGPPGSGKTVACIKIAARALLQEHEACIIGADNIRVGGIEQLMKYCGRLSIDLMEANNNRELISALETCSDNELVLIDTPGVNPYQPTELAHIAELCDINDVEVLLVIDGGRSSVEACELVEAFRHVLPTRLLVTKIDVARRVGSLLHAADQGKLAISEVSLNPQISDGLYPLSPQSLARLMVSNVSVPSDKNHNLPSRTQRIAG